MYQPQYDPYYRNMAVIKKYFNTKLLLAGGIFRIISIALSVLTGIALIPVLQQVLPQLFEILINGEKSYVSNGNLSLNVSTGNIGTYLIPAASAFSSFFIFFKSKNENPFSNPSAGFLIKMIIAVFLFVSAIIRVAISSLATVFGIILAVKLSDSFFSVFLVVCVLLAVLILMILTLMLSVFNLHWIKSVRHSLTQPQLQNKGAKPAGVLTVVTAVFYGWFALAFLGLLVLAVLYPQALRNRFIVPSRLIFPAACCAASCVLSVILSIINAKIYFGYHRYIHDINNGQLAPVIPIVEYTSPVEPFDPSAARSVHQPYEMHSHTIPDIDCMTTDRPIGYPVSQYCRNCGCPLNDDAVFCPRCGTRR